jgi:hypothetical protein
MANSTMNCGETVQARHRAFLADWHADRFVVLASLRKSPIDWEVDVANLTSALV